MGLKKYCCIAADDSMAAANSLIDEISRRIGLSIAILGSTESTVEYEVVMIIISKGLVKDACLSSQLKEARDLNKTFIPVILAGNWINRLLLKQKFKSNKLYKRHIYSLGKTSEMLDFYKQLMSLAGCTISGDPFGKVFTFISDSNCKISRNGEVIAEIKKDIPKTVTLYKGKHYLKVSNALIGSELHIPVKVDRLEGVMPQTIEVRFHCDVYIKSEIDCTLLENDVEIARLAGGETTVVKLWAGNHKLKFAHPKQIRLNRYISLNIAPNESKYIVHRPPKSPREVCKTDFQAWQQ